MSAPPTGQFSVGVNKLALKFFVQLYEVEREVRGHDALQRKRIRQERVDLTRFHRHISASSTKLLECQRAQKVKMTVPADSIVETLDVVEHV